MKHHTLHGAGLALRPALLAPLSKRTPDNLQFLELTPPDWIGVGGRVGNDLQQLTHHYPAVCLSQSLSLGGPGALDQEVLRDLRAFIAEHNIQVFSEALAWSADDAPLFINLPIPSTQAAVAWTVARIAQVQDALGMRIGIRNVAHRMVPKQVEMNEAQFINAVVQASGCRLHLDLHALAANALHFKFDPHAFIQALPLASIDYVRVGREYPLLGDLLARTHRRVARCVDDVKQLNLGGCDMLNDFRQFQFALARHLRDPLSVPAPEGVSAAYATVCTHEMAKNLSDVLDPAFPVTRALLGEDLWQHAVRLFLKDAPSHTPWASTVQRAFVEHVCESPDMENLPAWLQDLAHFEWLQNAVSTAPVTWPVFDARGDVMQHAVVLNPTHVEAAYEWPVHGIDTDHKPDDMQSTYVSMLRDADDALHVCESSVFRGQLIDLLREGQTGEQALRVLARWLLLPDAEAFVHEGAELIAQLQREGVVLGTRIANAA